MKFSAFHPIFCLIFVALLFSCKKKEDKTEDPPPPKPKQVSVKINNTLYTCDVCANTYYSSGFHGVNVSETGTTNRFIFNFNSVPAVGTHTLEKYGHNSFTYERNGHYYRGRGTLNVTAVETGGSGSISLFNATFSCLTDTASDNSHFSFTEGVLNLNFK